MWSAAIAAGVVLLAAGRMQMVPLSWAAGMVLLLALADAGQVAMARVFTDSYNRFMQKLPLNGGNAMKAEEFVLPAPELGWRDAGKVLGALGSFSVWPFYAALLALLVAFLVANTPESGGRNAESGKPAIVTGTKHSAGCSAGGGCGTSGGSGSGGCGASAGKGCGCGSEAKVKVATPATPLMPAVNMARQPARPMPQGVNGLPPFPIRTTPLPSPILSPLPASAPRQVPGQMPGQATLPPPGAPYLSAPPRFPSRNGASPAKIAPAQNGTPPIPSGADPTGERGRGGIENGTPQIPAIPAAPSKLSEPPATPAPPVSPPAPASESKPAEQP